MVKWFLGPEYCNERCSDVSGAKVVGLIVLGLLLFGVVGAANVVTTAERTALNGEYVNDRLDSSGSYDAIQNATVNQILDRIETANLSEGQQLLQAGNGTDNRTLVEDAVTEQYIRDQTSDNILALYAYLHGEESSLDMEIDLRPLKDNLAESFAGQVQKKDTSTLFREFGPSEDETPVPINENLVEQMRSGPEGYEQARLDFRVDIGFEVTNNDEKLILIGEDPRQYSEQEKQRIVDNREQEIRNELRQEIDDRGSDVSQRVRNEIQQRRADAKDQVCQATVDELQPDAGQQVCSGFYQDSSDTTHLDNVTRAAVELQSVVIDGLTRDDAQYDYNDFDTDLTSSEDHLANETGDLAASRIETEVPDSLSAQEQFGEDATNTLENAQGAVGTIDTVYLALPVIALLLIAIAFAMTRSLETTATFTGIVLALSGGLFFIIATALGGTISSRAETAIEDAELGEFAEVAVTIIEGVLGVLATQSAILLVVGIVLIVLAYVSKSGQLDGLKAKVAGSGGGGGTGGSQPPRQTQQQNQQRQAQQQPQQPRQPQQPQQPQQGGRQGGQRSGKQDSQNRGGQN